MHMFVVFEFAIPNVVVCKWYSTTTDVDTHVFGFAIPGVLVHNGIAN